MLTNNPIAYLQNQLNTLSLGEVVHGLLFLAATVILLGLLLRLLNARRLFKQPVVYLELTPPAFQDVTPLATEELFSVLHGLDATRTFVDRLLLRKVVLAMEVVSTRDKGIRYIARVAKSDVAIFRQNVTSYLPDVQIKTVKDFLSSNVAARASRVIEFKQTGHFAYPLQSHESLAQHDPIAYLNGAMTKLEPDELVAFQLVVSPARIPEAHRIDKKILANKDARAQLGRGYHSLNILHLLSIVVRMPFYFINGVIYEVFYSYDRGKTTVTVTPHRSVSPAEQQLIDAIHGKLTQPLFRVNIRALVVTDDKPTRKEKVKGLRASLASFTMPKYQALRARRQWIPRVQALYRAFLFQHRLPSILSGNTTVLSAAEVASLYHFPHSITGKTENVMKSLSKTLPAPVSLKNGTDLDIILGMNKHQGTETPISLTKAERERHAYVIGGTGNGKTTMLQYGIIQDIQNGHGVAVVDPHGDLATTILEHIPEERIKDVIYFEPRDIGYPIGLNLMELPDGLSEDDLALEQDFVTEAIVSIFRKTFSADDSGGHRIEYILRNAIHTAFTVKDATIFTLYDLLTDSAYRKEVIAKLDDDKRLQNFWKEEFGKAGAMQRVKMGSGVTNKLGRFDRSATARRVMEQPKSTIDFDDILNSNKILICNFAKGAIGEDTSELFGIAILAKLQLAALRRYRVQQTVRTPYYLYVDEFQNFATMSFVQLLSEARKYKLFLTMAEQSTSQQEQQQLVDIILANVGTVVCFRSGSPADERFILPLFRRYLDEGEIANLPAYNFYARIAAVQPQEPMSGETLLLEEEGSKTMAKRVIASSRKLYASKYEKKQLKKAVPQKSETKPNAKQATDETEQQPLQA